MIDTKIKSKIEDIQNYFIKEILKSEIEIKDGYSCFFEVDGYKFEIWISNGSKHIKTQSIGSEYFMHLDFSESDKLIIWGKVKEKQSEINQAKIKELQLSINKLKKVDGLD